MKYTMIVALLVLFMSCTHRLTVYYPTGKVIAQYYAIGPAGPMFTYVRVDSLAGNLPKSIKK